MSTGGLVFNVQRGGAGAAPELSRYGEGTECLEVHHVRKLADLNKPGRRRPWSPAAAATRTSTLAGQPSPTRNDHWSRVRGNPQALFGKRPTEKVPNHGHLVGGRLHSVGAGGCDSLRLPDPPLSPMLGLWGNRHQGADTPASP
jgi:hypothetical protein